MVASLSAAFSVAVSVCLALGVRGEPEPSRTRLSRVRTFEPELARLVQEGIDRSLTFRREVERIGQTDGIVYIQSGQCSVSSAAGCLMLDVRDTAHTRYL